MSIPPQLLHSVDGIRERAKDALYALTSCLCHPSAKVKINGRTCPLFQLARYTSSSLTQLSTSQDCKGPWRGWLLICIPCPGRRQWCGSCGRCLKHIESYRIAILASVRSQEDPLPHWLRRRQGSHEGGGGISPLQVCIRTLIILIILTIY